MDRQEGFGDNQADYLLSPSVLFDAAQIHPIDAAMLDVASGGRGKGSIGWCGIDALLNRDTSRLLPKSTLRNDL